MLLWEQQKQNGTYCFYDVYVIVNNATEPVLL